MMKKLSGINSNKILDIALMKQKKFVKKMKSFVKILD